jgi:hypothetical protein
VSARKAPRLVGPPRYVRRWPVMQFAFMVPISEETMAWLKKGSRRL